MIAGSLAAISRHQRRYAQRHRTVMRPEPPRPARLDVIEGSNLMKLYFAPHACSLSPHIVLRELGLPFELVRVNNKTKQTSEGRSFLEVNPKGYVAALVLDNGEVLTE